VKITSGESLRNVSAGVRVCLVGVIKQVRLGIINRLSGEMTKQRSEPMTLKEVIIKNISYDGDGGEVCPHCKKYIRKPNYWLDHKWTLASVIAKFKGYPEAFVEKIEEILDGIDDITGNPEEDSESIIKELKE